MALSPAQRRLADLLKVARSRSGMSTIELGRLLGWPQTRVSRSELARRRISVAEAAAWAETTSASPELRAEIAGLAEEAARDVRSWWSGLDAGMTGRQHEIAALESAATLIRNTQLIVPGLLQTADYARRAMALANVSSQGDVAAAVAARMRRQEVLYDPAKRFEYVLPESALRARLSDDAVVMRAQADRLLSLDTLPNISIAVLPVSVPLNAWPSAFVIYEIPDEPLVVIETLTDEIVLGDDRDVSAYREAFARLQVGAVTGADAHELIRQAMSG